MSQSPDGNPGAREPDSGALWDDWVRARKLEPRLTPREFLGRRGPVIDQVLDELELLLALEFQSPPSPLVDAVALDVGAGEVRFAGFRLLETLGQGSSGIVYLARDQRGGANHGSEAPLVALKVLNPLLSASPERRDTILHEAEVARSLDHEGIVRVLASGIERGYAWIATEYVEGETLDRLIGKEDRPPLREALALDIGQQLARSLEHAHARGVVHRDLKPSNLILSDDGRLKVLDFGLARTQGTAFSMSRTGEMIGTPLYMAPEQARGAGEIGPWTDVYAVGLVLWEIASGRKLDEDEPLHALLARIARGRYRIRSRDLRGINPGLASVIRRCLEPHPADRYQNCAALLADLDDVRAGREPRMGAMSMLRRWARARARNRVRTAAWVVGIGLLGWSNWYVWWTWPQEVEFTTVENGKQIWIDDVQRESSTARMTLRPGRHAWKAQFTDQNQVYSGTFEVDPRSSLHVLKFLSPWHGPFELPHSESVFDLGEFAWIVIATPTEWIHLKIDGTDVRGVGRDEVPGISAIPLRFGLHTIEVASPGMRSWKRENLDLRSQELCFLPFEMEAIDSAWETIVLYAPFDDLVQHSIVEQHGLRMYCEEGPLSHLESYNVRKPYWGPDRAFEEGTVLIAVPLPEGVEDLELELAAGPMGLVPSAFEKCEIGGAPSDLHTVLDVGGPLKPPPGAPSIGHRNGLDFHSPDRAMLDPVLESIRGQRVLCVKWSIGGVMTGSDYAYTFAMRSNALPDRPLGRPPLWSPALRVRVKTRR